MNRDRKVKVSDLVSATEIAERLELSKPQVVHVWRTRHADFPEPVYMSDRVLIWAWPDIEKWARASGRLPKG